MSESRNIVGEIRYIEEVWTGMEWIKSYTFSRRDSEVIAFICRNARFNDYWKCEYIENEQIRKEMVARKETK